MGEIYIGTIKYSDNRDKKAFVDASLTVGKFITWKNNRQGLEELKKILLKHIESITFEPFNNRPISNLGNASTIGVIKVISAGHYGTNNIEQEKEVRHVITHELMHAHAAAIQKENPKRCHS